MNTARAKAGIATAEYKEVVDFAERLRYVLELKINKLRIAMQKSTHLEGLTELRIATSDEEMSLDKTEYSMDLLDSLRLAFEYIVY